MSITRTPLEPIGTVPTAAAASFTLKRVLQAACRVQGGARSRPGRLPSCAQRRSLPVRSPHCRLHAADRRECRRSRPPPAGRDVRAGRPTRVRPSHERRSRALSMPRCRWQAERTLAGISALVRHSECVPVVAAVTPGAYSKRCAPSCASPRRTISHSPIVIARAYAPDRHSGKATADGARLRDAGQVGSTHGGDLGASENRGRTHIYLGAADRSNAAAHHKGRPTRHHRPGPTSMTA